MLEFLSSNQGAGNAGKLLKVDTDGSVITAEVAGATVDDEMSTVSTNPVQNKVISTAVNAVTEKADYLEDGLSDTIHHYHDEEVFSCNTMSNPYPTSIFNGWAACIGHPRQVDKVQIVYTTRADCPVTKVQLKIFRINAPITDDDFASASSNHPRIGDKLELLATKVIEYDEPVTTVGEKPVMFELDETVYNPDDKTLMAEFQANNYITFGFTYSTTKPTTTEAGYCPGVNWTSIAEATPKPATSFSAGLSSIIGDPTATCNTSNQNVRTHEAQGQYMVLARTTVIANIDEPETILFDPSRVGALEDQLYDDFEHSEDHVIQDWTNKGSPNYYATSTFSGWCGSIGRPSKFNYLEFDIIGRGSDAPITQVRCQLYKMTRDLVESDYTYTEGATNPYSNPILGNLTEKVFDKTLTFDEPITGTQRVRFYLDETIDNTDNLQYIAGYSCNNCVSGGDRRQTGGTSPFDGGFTGPWIAYTTWGGTGGPGSFDTYILSTTRSPNLVGNAYTNEHKTNPQYDFMGAKIGWIETWTERYISTESDGKVGTIVQGVIEDMGIQEQLDEAMAATQLVQLASIVEYQGSSSLNLVENPTSGYTYADPSSTFDGECFPIGPVSAEVPIGGFRVPLKIRSYSTDTDTRFRTANLAKVELWACDYTMENNTTAWSGSGADPNFNPVKVAEKSIEIDLDLDNPEKLSGVYDFVFDEPFYNTEGKHLYLAYWINARIYRPKVSGVSLLYYLNNKYNLGLTSVKSFYSAFTAKQTSAVENIMKANRWQNENVIAFSIITAHDGYIASDLFNEWVDERTSDTIAEEVDDYLSHHDLPVPASYEVRLAKKYTAVVGDTLQLFFDGLVKGYNVTETADIHVVCSKGKVYPRYWEFTPSAEDANTSTTLKLYVRNFQGEIVSQGTTTIEVVTVPTFAEAKTVNMLIFGDSLTSSGSWAAEGIRRLVGTDTSVTPASQHVANLTISTYGRKHNTINTQLIYHEGYGGWTWGSFLDDGRTSTDLGIFVTLDHTVPWDLNTVQHSAWVDNLSRNWKLEDIDGAVIKFDRGPGNTESSATAPLPTSLHCSDLSLDITSTEITSCVWEAGNPFWNELTQSVDFLTHAAELDHAPADVVGILLTWNGGGSGWSAANPTWAHQGKINTHITNATTLIRDIHTQLPNAKVVCMGIQLSSVTGGNGSNYGAGDSYADTIGTNYYAFDYDQQLEALVTNEEFGQYCYYVDTKGQFDTKWLMPYSNTKVNTRSTVTEPRGTNGVHPSEAGYYAIGDAFYRQLCKVLPTLS